MDKTFGANGIVTTDLGSISDNINSVCLQSDGKIVVGGGSNLTSYYDFSLARYNQNGTLDTTFGVSGVVTTVIGSNNDQINSIAVQDDGKIVAAGSYNLSSALSDFATVRYNTDGSLDSTFGNNGIVTTNINLRDIAYSLVIQSDSKIVVFGVSILAESDFAMVRYNQDGSPDNTFGTNGIVITPVGSSNDYGRTILLSDKGTNIFTAGYSNIIEGLSFVLVSYNSSGEIDNNFGNNGLAITSHLGLSKDNQAICSLIQNDGKIVSAGFSGAPGNDDFTLFRYNNNGELDNTFGYDGGTSNEVLIHSNDNRIFSIASQKDGKIIAAGYANNGTDDDFALARYNENGLLDVSFGNQGVVITPIGSSNERIRSVELQDDGKIITAGFSNNGTDDDFIIVRYDSVGNIDNSFGTNGIVTMQFFIWDEVAISAVIQSDGKIIVAGYANNGAEDDFALVRLNPNGSLDNTFGIGGYVVTETGIYNERIRSIALQDDGKIIAVGYSNNGLNNDFAILRYKTNGSLDSTFGINGVVKTPIGIENDAANGCTIQSDGKILAAGVTNLSGKNNCAIVRYNTNGDIDSSFGTNGITIFNIGSNNSTATSVKLQNDEEIVVSGHSTDSSGHSLFLVLRYLNDTFMPVELTSLTAAKSESDNSITLNWTTATEINNFGYEVQRSLSPTPSQGEGASDSPILLEGGQGVGWEKIAFVNGHGNSTVINHYKYLDKEILNSNRVYRLKQIDFDGGYEYSREVEVAISVPTKFELYQNYPNPFNPTTKIKYSIPASLNPSQGGTLIQLKIYDILGREVATLVNEKKQLGTYEMTFDGNGLSSGVYFYQLKSGSFTQTKKLMLLK